jgi:hypothetical protein
MLNVVLMSAWRIIFCCTATGVPKVSLGAAGFKCFGRFVMGSEHSSNSGGPTPGLPGYLYHGDC